MMHGREKSDSAIVAVKPTNKAVPTATEPVEPRAGAKGNARQQSTHRTQGRQRVTQALERGAWLKQVVRGFFAYHAVPTNGRAPGAFYYYVKRIWLRNAAAARLPAVQSDPELFQSLARPGGSLTGFSAFGEEMSAKRIEMLKEILPGLKKLGVMHNATDPTFSAWGEQTMVDTKKLGIEPVRAGLTAPSSAAVTAQFKKLAEAGGTAMIVIRDYMTAAMTNEICRAGLEMKIAVIGEQA